MNAIINCIVIDDNNLDRLIIEDYVSQCSSLKLLGSFSNPVESIETIKAGKIQLLFMDIDMPVINGIDFFKKLENPPVCIFVTTYPEYALEAFNTHAFDYLLKPVKKERFEQAVKRTEELFDIQAKALLYDMNVEHDTLTIKEGNTINKVLISDIIYLEALTNYTKVVTNNKKYITLCNLKNFLEELPQEKFLRVHRSYAVAKNKINRLESGELILGEHKIPLGKTYRQQINKIISEKAR